MLSIHNSQELWVDTMHRTGLCLIFVLAIASSHSIQLQGIFIDNTMMISSLIGHDQCINYRCRANVGTVITIPCGDYHESDGVIFTYHNDSGNGEVLSTNTTLYYRLNVTVFDDNTRIVCQPNITGIGEYVYDLTIQCKYTC